MAKIAVTEERVFQVAADLERAYAFFSQPKLFQAAMEGVLSCHELGNGQVHWLLVEQIDQGVRFQPNYVVSFTCDGMQNVQWTFVGGNMRNEGEVRISPRVGGGSDIQYRETVEPDLPITPLLAKLVKPLVTRELRGGLLRFIERSQECLGS